MVPDEAIDDTQLVEDMPTDEAAEQPDDFADEADVTREPPEAANDNPPPSDELPATGTE